MDRNGGKKLIRQERYAKDARDIAAPQDAKDVGEGFGSVAGTRCKADVPVAKVVNPPIVPRTNGEDIPLILKDSLHQRTGSMQVVHFVGGDHHMYRRRGIGVRARRLGSGASSGPGARGPVVRTRCAPRSGRERVRPGSGTATHTARRRGSSGYYPLAGLLLAGDRRSASGSLQVTGRTL